MQRYAPEESNAWKAGAGGYKSSITDFARFGAGMLNRKLINEATEQQMWTLQTTTSGSPAEYGLGFAVSTQGPARVFHHGHQEETDTQLILYTQSRHGIVAMCNCGHGDSVKLIQAASAVLYRR